GMLATQHEEPVQAMVMIASHAGITRMIRTAAERAKIWAIFNVVAPIGAKLMGYVPVEALGMSKTIPLGVMLQWRRWTGQKQYFFDDPEFDFTERFAKAEGDRKSTRLNSSHVSISYAVFCLKKKTPLHLVSLADPPATPALSPLSLHDALPISDRRKAHGLCARRGARHEQNHSARRDAAMAALDRPEAVLLRRPRIRFYGALRQGRGAGVVGGHEG